MTTDWSKPTKDDKYLDFLANMVALATCAYCMSADATNIPTGAIVYDTTADKFKRWSGAAWVDLVIKAAGGGTGVTTALGTMSAQNASAVAITGGSVTASFVLAGSITMPDNTYDIGTVSAQVRALYVKTTLVIPVEAP